MRTRADSFASRVVAAAARPARPWLHITVSSRVARFLVAAGARPAPARRGGNLRNAAWSGADLTGADLDGADLTGADLTGADLTGADLTGAILARADLTGMLWSVHTEWPGAMAKAMKARSEEVRPGIWRVVGSGTGDAEIDAPLTPVG
jgi:pentapeptide repeat protein